MGELDGQSPRSPDFGIWREDESERLALNLDLEAHRSALDRLLGEGRAEPPQEGCDICRLGARADRRGEALDIITCRDGPEFLKRCANCGGFWRETLRFEQWLSRPDAAALFGDPF